MISDDRAPANPPPTPNAPGYGDQGRAGGGRDRAPEPQEAPGSAGPPEDDQAS